MKKALIIRGSKCFGDMIFISWTPKKIKEMGYHVTVSCWNKNKCIFENNPYVDDFLILDDIQEKPLTDVWNDWNKEYDKVFDFRYTVEMKYLKNSSDNDLSIEELRNRVKDKNYFKNSLEAYSLSGEKGEIYLSDRELKRANRLKNNGIKKILWQINGSGRNKQLLFLPAYITEINKHFSNIDHYVVGDKQNLGQIEDSIKDMRDAWSPRETISYIKAMDLVVGPESFMVNAAGALDIPTLTFFSHSAPENLTKHYKNAHSVIPECDCHPCYLIAKDFRQLYNDLDERRKARIQENKCILRNRNDHLQCVGYKCCIQINHNEVVNKIINILKR